MRLHRLPGAVHNLTAARTHAIIDALTNADVMTFADRGHKGVGGTIRTPVQTAARDCWSTPFWTSAAAETVACRGSRRWCGSQRRGGGWFADGEGAELHRHFRQATLVFPGRRGVRRARAGRGRQRLRAGTR